LAHYNTVLHQLLSLVPRHQFENRVRELQGDKYVKKFSTWNQLTVLLYSQASGKSSLRDIQNALSSQINHLYHLGLPDSIARSTMSDANAKRDYRIYEDLFHRLLERCQKMAPHHRFSFRNPLVSIDSTVIELSVGAFPWARYAKAHGGFKLHYGLDHSGNIPNFVVASARRTADIKIARSQFPIVPDSIYCFDRGYVDGAWFSQIHDEKAFFVTRAKSNMKFAWILDRGLPADQRVMYDREVESVNVVATDGTPCRMRLIGFIDTVSGRQFRFLTNNLSLPAVTIAEIYKARWQIEAFFKWIKQNLRIKTFFGTSKNAVLSQIWIAMCYYLLLAYVKFQSRYAHSLFYLHRLVRETLLDRLSLIDLLGLTERRIARIRDPEPQLALQF
jgi:hypothetical protein